MGRDLAAGLITGAMAIPLSVGIAMMSDYPIKLGLATVSFACLIGWINAWFRPGNYIGCPGIAAGLAPVLAVGVATFGLENMPFAIFLTAIIQAIIWKFNWQRYLLLAVPVYLVEGLLAGVGLKIAL
ncbi:MAG: SulP family inorganic anion transporter, partial [Nitrospira sp.]|nr:SulP family inorganic anion transporter [Nitrospira sp.]